MSDSRILIDSHILVWLLYEPNKISSEAQELLRSAETVYLSTISIWELALKHYKSKLLYSPSELIKGAQDLNLERLPVNDSHILALKSVRLAQADPFDAMLVAQSVIENCKLMTTDNSILRSKYATVQC